MAFYDGCTTVILFDVENRKVVELFHDSNFANLVSIAMMPEGKGFCLATVVREGDTFVYFDKTDIV